MVNDKRTQEICSDIIQISDTLLEKIYAAGYDETNDTAHGRIIFQLLWFKQQIENKRLKLPLERDDRSSLSYIYTHGNISDINDADFNLHQLIKLSQNKLLIKPIHFPELINKINELLSLMSKPPRALTDDEKKIITELQDVIPKLEKNEILPYKDFTRETYPGLWFIYTSWDGSSLDDIPYAGELIKTISEGLLQGIRDNLGEIKGVGDK